MFYEFSRDNRICTPLSLGFMNKTMCRKHLFTFTTTKKRGENKL